MQYGFLATSLTAVLLAMPALAGAAPAGSLDPSFSGDGVVFADPTEGGAKGDAVALQSGKVVTAGVATDTSFPGYSAGGCPCYLVLTRYNADGAPDPTFGNGGPALTRFPNDMGLAAVSLLVQGDGRVVTAIEGNFKVYVTRHTASGAPDPTFDGDGVAQVEFGGGRQTVTEAVVAGDKVALSGSAGGLGRSSFSLARLNADGSPDTGFGGDGNVTVTFNDGTNGPSDRANALVADPDGKLVAAGFAQPYDGSAPQQVALARVLPNGSPDTTFGSGGRVRTSVPGHTNPAAWEIVRLPDGKYLVVGSATASDGTSKQFFARYTANGTLDTSFGSGGFVFPNVGVNELVVAGSHLVGSTTADGGAGVVRFNLDGTPDTSFGSGGLASSNYGCATASATDVAVKPDGDAIVAGSATPTGGHSLIATARFLGTARPGDAPAPRCTNTPPTTTPGGPGQTPTPPGQEKPKPTPPGQEKPKPTPPGQQKPRPKVKSASLRILKLKGGKLRVRVACPRSRPRACTGVMALRAKVSGQKRALRLGSRRFRVAPGRKRTYSVALPATASRVVAGGRRMSIVLDWKGTG